MKITSMKTRSLTAALLVLIALAAHDVLRSDSAEESRAAVTQSGPSDGVQFVNPRIAEHGQVVRLPAAVDQPRRGAKICVDVTAGGPPESINPAIEKVARYVNIYAGAGREPAEAEITVCLHGEATLCALSADDYAQQFQTDGNPSLALMRELRESGVEFRVCGQSLAGKGFTAANVCDDVEVAVSALTVLVNRQADGYAYVPLK
jgi:intracellular sulfur oxidation DsrE/DsrF family protein